MDPIIRNTPARIRDALLDPVRRRHVAGKLAESLVAVYTGFLAIRFIAWWAGPLGVVIEFLFYEWVTERLGIAGHYWERSARDGERFVRP